MPPSFNSIGLVLCPFLRYRGTVIVASAFNIPLALALSVPLSFPQPSVLPHELNVPDSGSLQRVGVAQRVAVRILSVITSMGTSIRQAPGSLGLLCLIQGSERECAYANGLKKLLVPRTVEGFPALRHRSPNPSSAMGLCCLEESLPGFDLRENAAEETDPSASFIGDRRLDVGPDHDFSTSLGANHRHGVGEKSSTRHICMNVTKMVFEFTIAWVDDRDCASSGMLLQQQITDYSFECPKLESSVFSPVSRNAMTDVGLVFNVTTFIREREEEALCGFIRRRYRQSPYRPGPLDMVPTQQIETLAQRAGKATWHPLDLEQTKSFPEIKYTP
ncbi:hypothetical protein F5148DRAFT_1152788 [Russula earlei]|uniref:Uncharacterized protein n=1 Tax=Russula earlei TaxID=71964 RepID=A0ACC0TX30_9AGAM|nr:hypothetical protein F5148DRAFT_1152788 [Russula earlei]